MRRKLMRSKVDDAECQVRDRRKMIGVVVMGEGMDARRMGLNGKSAWG